MSVVDSTTLGVQWEAAAMLGSDSARRQPAAFRWLCRHILAARGERRALDEQRRLERLERWDAIRRGDRRALLASELPSEFRDAA